MRLAAFTLNVAERVGLVQSPETLRAFQKAEAERWWPIIKGANIQQQ